MTPRARHLWWRFRQAQRPEEWEVIGQKMRALPQAEQRAIGLKLASWLIAELERANSLLVEARLVLALQPKDGQLAAGVGVLAQNTPRMENLLRELEAELRRDPAVKV